MLDCLIQGEILFRQLTCNALPIPDWLSPRLLAPAAAKMERESVEAKLQPPKAVPLLVELCR